MNKFLLIVGATTLALAAYVVMNDQFQHAAPVGGLAGAAHNLSTWGAKQRLFGGGGQLKGKVEKGLGDLAGDPAVQGKGLLDEATGALKNAAGKAAQAIGSTLTDLNS